MYDDVGLRKWSVKQAAKILQFEGKGGHWKPSHSYNTVEELLYYYEVRA